MTDIFTLNIFMTKNKIYFVYCPFSHSRSWETFLIVFVVIEIQTFIIVLAQFLALQQRSNSFKGFCTDFNSIIIAVISHIVQNVIFYIIKMIKNN